jgi:divalent metal cation (Fe/Co/Zn/Cd) transporter
VAISWYALRVTRATESVAFEATARDMLADVFSSCAVLVGLIDAILQGEELEKKRRLLRNVSPTIVNKVLNFHKLRTRKAGQNVLLIYAL